MVRCVKPLPIFMCLPLARAELYLQSPLQLEHACDIILDSELFAFHSERMCEILTDETAGVSHVLHYYSCALNELMPSLSEHRSPRSIYAVQCSALPRTSQPKLPSLTQTMAAVNSPAHGPRSC